MISKNNAFYYWFFREAVHVVAENLLLHNNKLQSMCENSENIRLSGSEICLA